MAKQEKQAKQEKHSLNSKQDKRSASGLKATISACWIVRQPILWKQPSVPAPALQGRSPCRRAVRFIRCLRSPNIDRKSREQFEIRTHKRLVDILNPTGKTIDALKTLTLPAGVDIKIKA